MASFIQANQKDTTVEMSLTEEITRGGFENIAFHPQFNLSHSIRTHTSIVRDHVELHRIHPRRLVKH